MQLEEVYKFKLGLEDKISKMAKEKSEMGVHLEEIEEELQNLLNRYKAKVSQASQDQSKLNEQSNVIASLEEERNKLKESLADYMQKIQNLESGDISNSSKNSQKLELQVKELETKLDLDSAARNRLESQINRLKAEVNRLNIALEESQDKEREYQDSVRKLQKQLKDCKEDLETMQVKEMDLVAKKMQLENDLEASEMETDNARSELKVAIRRIEDLQSAITGDLDLDNENQRYNLNLIEY